MKSRTFYLSILILLGTFGCTNSNADLEEKNKDIVKHAFEVVGNGDYEGMDKYLAENYTRHCQATPDLKVESLEEFKAFIKADRLSIPDQKLDVKMLVAEDDLVAFWATYSGTQTGQMGPFPPSGKKADLDFAGVHRLENGKIAETWVTWDNLAILTQLGHFPPAPPSEPSGQE